ncbi:SOS response-associated peptidase [Aestuariivirga litoralis]|uniref:SOS response-associated peptidase n=1 Tax=Aestuariivirga litoralis TaxID=2650924 RepID=UPI0018C6FFBB|nr:SOS response-associated peptidase [Aestuariivirga litoralis]MBG1230823.1 SOS response-associated peptidase [Aestuariivirga litoralis]
MCVLRSLRRGPEEIRHLLKYINAEDFPPREYITPGSPTAIVRRNMNGAREMVLVRWGFVPSWAKEILPGKPLVNARAETVYEKASFKNAIRRRRCLIPADGFYEWQGDVPGRKQAWYIHKPDQTAFALGGIYEHWLGAHGSELESAAVLTCASGMPVAAIHERSPVVILPEDYERWLSQDEQVQDLLKPPPDDFWTMEKTIIARPRKPEVQTPPPAPKPQMDLL